MVCGEIKIALTLRLLAGRSYLDLHLIYGIRLLCSSDCETCDHVLHCPNEHMVRRREDLLDDFKQGLRKLKTMPYMTSFLATTVRYWLSNSPIEAPNNTEHPFHEKISDAHRRQEQVGYNNFIQGMVVTEWRNLISE